MEDTERIHLLDLIKGILIIFIIITHYNWTDEQRQMLLFPYWIDMAVPVFMIISGYVYALSYKRKEINSLKDAYEFKEITSKLIRYSVPLLMAFVFEVFLYVISGIKIELSCVLTGGIGPGSFYYPVMIQFVYLYPLIYFAIREYDLKGLCVCGIVNVVFEIAKTLYGMPTSEYRFMVLRYILLIATGCYLAIGKQKIRRPVLIVSMLVGIFWQYAVYYLGYKPVIINEAWATTSCISALYIIPICVSIFASKKMMDARFGLLELIGRASFNIFLTQMVYFIGAKVIYKIVSDIWIANLLNIVICCLVGTIFYMIESRITRYLLQYLDKKNYFEKQIRAVLKKIGNVFKDSKA
ncbi:MAG: hypothetical protein IKS51_08540 [Erysipelotrichaceae bacterium]|nr:hypothetical protein [Erysipelotrichaceae bacterium]